MSHRNAPLHPILRLIYFLLRLLSRAGISVFYRRRLVLGRENLRFEGPAIVISNHPSTLMDPLNVGINIRQEMFFLANYGLFKNPVSNWILTRLYCIPVKRKEDVAEGEVRDNDGAFEQSFRHLEKNGLLFIAAEGVSWMNRYVRPFKTGAARIAFGAERRHAWQLGVKIIPVGLSYDAPQLFRSRTIVEYGAPMDPSAWQAAYQQDPEKAVEDFTEAIRTKVASLTLDSGSEAGDLFVTQTEILLRNHPSGLSERESYFFFKDFLAKNLENQVLKNQVSAYFKALDQAQLTDSGVFFNTQTGFHGQNLLMMLLLSPFFLVGYLFWFLPCWLPWLLCKKLHLYPGYDSNVKMLAGLFTFPIALWGGWKLAFWLFKSSLWAWVGLIGLVFCAYLAEYFMDYAGRWSARNKARIFQKQNPETWTELITQRKAILAAVLGK